MANPIDRFMDAATRRERGIFDTATTPRKTQSTAFLQSSVNKYNNMSGNMGGKQPLKVDGDFGPKTTGAIASILDQNKPRIPAPSVQGTQAEVFGRRNPARLY